MYLQTSNKAIWGLETGAMGPGQGRGAWHRTMGPRAVVPGPGPWGLAQVDGAWPRAVGPGPGQWGLAQGRPTLVRVSTDRAGDAVLRRRLRDSLSTTPVQARGGTTDS